MADVEKSIRVGVSALRLLGGLISTVEGLFSKKLTGSQKKDLVMKQAKSAYRVGSALNVIGEKDAEEGEAMLDNIFSPAIDELVEINNEFSLWSRVKSFFGGIFDRDEPPATPPGPQVLPGEFNPDEVPG